MDFFDDINKVIENAGNTAKQKTKDLTDVAKMNASIKTEAKRLQELYQKIGEIYVKKYYAETELLFQELVGQAREAESNIEAYNAKIQEIKKVDTCPNCGNEIPTDAVFCMRCGTRLIPESHVEKAEEGKKCKNCGHLLEDGVMFCTSCVIPIEKLEEQTEDEKSNLNTFQEAELRENQTKEVTWEKAEDRFTEETEKEEEKIYDSEAIEEQSESEVVNDESDYQKEGEIRKRFCVRCGHELEADNRFCTICGTPIENN